MASPLTRRRALQQAGVLGAGALVGGALSGGGWARVVERAAAVPARGSDLGAIDHLIFLTMENRSYDCYFGAYPRGRGFDDHPRRALGAFAQEDPGGTGLDPRGWLLPYRLDTAAGPCTVDPTHDWGPAHLCWNGGRMDGFVRTHTSSAYEGANGAVVMGYYERSTLGFLWSLADHFTLCDRYHCSVLGPTHPNRLMQLSGTIDPDGRAGGPITDTNARPYADFSCTWPTMPEILQDHGVSWKLYSPSNVGVSGKYAGLANYRTWNPALYDPALNPEVMFTSDHVLPYFPAFRNPASPLYGNAFGQTFPNDFVADVESGSLPSVSWILPPQGFDEHPAASPQRGMYFTSLVLDALIANPAVWSRTALVLSYDENGGFFDHVAPPVPPRGTPGEFLTAAPVGGNPSPDTLGITGPVGLGVRVPALVISPFSRGGHVASEVFDHTSQLKLISERFGVGVPNVSAWRRRTVGDLSSTMFRSRADARMPALPPITIPTSGGCDDNTQDTELGGTGPTVPPHQRMPRQGGGSTAAGVYFSRGKPRPVPQAPRRSASARKRKPAGGKHPGAR